MSTPRPGADARLDPAPVARTPVARALVALALVSLATPACTPQELPMHAHSPVPSSSPAAPPAATPAAAPATWHCRHCGRHLFDQSEIKSRRPLWDLGEEKAEVFVLESAAGLDGLRRYDASLHEGYYCCRFALMRMVVDKFGTGRDLLAYVADVVGVPKGGEVPTPRPAKRGQVRLGARDFDAVTLRDDGVLRVVKLSATWCPPCRLVDTALGKIARAGGVSGVEVLEVDVDDEQALAERLAPASIPTLLFFYGGKQLRVQADRVASVRGALVGGIPSARLRTILTAVRDAARRGQTDISVRGS